MDFPKFIVSNQKKESICIQGVIDLVIRISPLTLIYLADNKDDQ